MAREVLEGLTGGPYRVGPFRVERAGRWQISFVANPAWTYFRSRPGHRRNRAMVRIGEMTALGLVAANGAARLYYGEARRQDQARGCEVEGAEEWGCVDVA